MLPVVVTLFISLLFIGLLGWLSRWYEHVLRVEQIKLEGRLKEALAEYRAGLDEKAATRAFERDQEKLLWQNALPILRREEEPKYLQWQRK